MSDVAKPGVEVSETEALSKSSPSEQPKSAEPTVEFSDEQKAYLKGIGIEDARSIESLQKIIDVSIKQKSSVSRSSREIEELKARLSSQGKEIDLEKEEEAEVPTKKPEVDASKATSNGVSDNDLFDLSRMFNEFPELSEEAQDGRIFAELRQLGYFGVNGIDKKAIYDYLSAKNANAKELRELREFKSKYEKPDPSDAPRPGANSSLDLDGEMSRELARQIVLSGPGTPRHQEAREYLQKGL